MLVFCKQLFHSLGLNYFDTNIYKLKIIFYENYILPIVTDSSAGVVYIL
jgi:hypothetical protein